MPLYNIKFLHVPDTEDEESTLRALGDNAEMIRHRAKELGYRSFWAMPINTGNTHLEDSTLIAKIPLGFLGCDMPYSYGFGNISEQEKEFLAIIVDAMSELLYDLNFANNIDQMAEGNDGH